MNCLNHLDELAGTQDISQEQSDSYNYVADFIGSVFNKNKIKCPLCNEKTKYKEVKGTHIWSCPVCPFVAFEYYNKENTKQLTEHLK